MSDLLHWLLWAAPVLALGFWLGAPLWTLFGWRLGGAHERWRQEVTARTDARRRMAQYLQDQRRRVRAK